MDVGALLEAIGDPLVLVGGQRVASANRAAREAFGDHIVGADVRLALRHPRVIELLNADGGEATVTGLSTAASVWDVAVTRLDAANKLVTLRDRTAQTDMSRAHTDFVANASHELRTPLAAIIGYAETLLDDKAGADAPTRARFLAIMRTEAARLQRLVEDLMSLSRIEAERHDAPRDTVDLAALARSVAAEIQASQSRTVDVDARAAAQIVGDAGQLRQVIRNLLDNAFQYGGEPVSLSVAALDASVVLTVTDQGDGISADHLPRLTERFYRVDAARSRAAGGTGLGLAIVKHIAQRHRARLDIRSRPREGAVVTLTFPQP